MAQDDISFTDLIASSIHDMKNSLNLQVNALEKIALQCRERGDTAAFDDLGSVIYQASRMNLNLVVLLSLYKLGKSMYPVSIDDHSVADVIEEAVLQNKPMMDFKGIAISIDCPPDCYWYIDRELIKGVLVNALNNAYHYTTDKIHVIANRLPLEIREKVRRFGLIFALVTRILLLLSLSWVMELTTPIFTITDHAISGRDLILLSGGFFLIWKASKEIYSEVELSEHDQAAANTGVDASKSMFALFIGSVLQIGLLDIIFSLDSVITAVGMVKEISIMISAVLASVLIMLIAAKPIGDFVHHHPSIKVLALSFLTVVGVVLIAEGMGVHIPKGYVYVAMAFSLSVELLNIRSREKRKKKN